MCLHLLLLHNRPLVCGVGLRARPVEGICKRLSRMALQLHACRGQASGVGSVGVLALEEQVGAGRAVGRGADRSTATSRARNSPFSLQRRHPQVLASAFAECVLASPGATTLAGTSVSERVLL